MLEHLRRLEARATPGLMAQVIPIFIDDTSERLVTLREAVLRRDGDTVRQVAHTLHGSAASVGASSMMVGCAAVIEGVRLGEFERCEAFVAELVADFESIRRAAEATGV